MSLPISVTLMPVLPTDLVNPKTAPVTVTKHSDSVCLENSFLCLTIERATGAISSLTQKNTRHRHMLAGDRLGWSYQCETGMVDKRFVHGQAPPAELSLEVQEDDASTRVIFSASAARIIYTLTPSHFWVERHIEITLPGQPFTMRDLLHGRCHLEKYRVREAALGKFDRPRFAWSPAHPDQGGLFAGLGGWFYSIDENGIYRNSEMDYAAGNHFVSDPWIIGIFKLEPGEPQPGWHWYRSFLQQRKDEYDKQLSWFHWNAGWGSPSIEMDQASSAGYFDLAKRLGLDHILFGHGYNGYRLEEYGRLTREDEVTRKNLAQLKSMGMGGGCIGTGANTTDDDVYQKQLEALDAFEAAPGFTGIHYDFFYITDTYTDHRRARDYLRRAREAVDYTECHLGMAVHGPQCQREVLVNHPADLERTNLSLFSVDWFTWFAFRISRAEWQRKYDYLMPESGLYYFTTHYHNGGHPRRYQDPEPAQLFYRLGSYCGGVFNFHDRFGYRDSLVATAVFSPYLTIGYLEKTMPEADVAFTQAFRRWTRENVAVLRRGRVCQEDGHTCVISKLAGQQGAIAVLNYTPGRKTIGMNLAGLGLATARIEPLYPFAAPALPVEAGRVEVTLPGESVLLLNVNGGLTGDLPLNPRTFPLDLDLVRDGQRWTARMLVPDVKAALQKQVDATVPRHLLMYDLVGGTNDGSETGQLPEGYDPLEASVMDKVGLPDVPEALWQHYGAKENRIETWKLAPWALADRLYLVVGFAENAPRLAQLLAGELVLKVNGDPVELMPRVEPRHERVADWTCPLLFADLTEHLAFGRENDFELQGGAFADGKASLRAAL